MYDMLIIYIVAKNQKLYHASIINVAIRETGSSNIRICDHASTVAMSSEIP